MIDLTAPYGASARGFHDKNIFADSARLLGRHSRVVLDVGAHQGEELPTYLEMFPDAVVHAIEPTPASFECLRDAYVTHPRVRVHWGALAESNGTGTLHAYGNSVINALTPYAPEPALGRERDMPTGFHSVRTWTLDTFCREQGIERIDLLKLDTQGAEGRVLDGATRLLRDRLVRLISLEALFVPLYEGQAEADELVAMLRQTGYHLFDWYNFAHNDRGQVLFGDAIFLPDYPIHTSVEPLPGPTSDPPSQPRLPSVELPNVEELQTRVTLLKAKTARLRRRLLDRDEKIRRLKLYKTKR